MPWESGRFESLPQFQRWARGRAESDNQTRALIAWILDHLHGLLRSAVTEGIARAFSSDVPPEEKPSQEQFTKRLDDLARAMPGYRPLGTEDDGRRDD